MGYSCTSLAMLTLNALMKQCNTGDSQNTWVGANQVTYFYEMGRENEDGAITGSIYKILGDGKCRHSNTFRIEPDGYITRFAHTTKVARRQAMINAVAQYGSTYGPVRLVNPQHPGRAIGHVPA